MSRFLVRLGLVSAFVISLAAIAASIKFAGVKSNEAWATTAVSLAVITSIFSAWSSQRVLELSEDEQKPHPYPSIDIMSRYELMQLRITNTGGGAAHDIRILWKVPLLNLNGDVVRFTKTDEVPDIPVLLPNESTSILIGVSRQMYQQFQDMNYSGELIFADSSKRRYKLPFHISAEAYRSSLIYNQEEPRTQRELQKIPEEIDKLTKELKALRSLFETLSNEED